MVDRYTKVTLTVIAFALCALAVENFKSAVAQQGGIAQVTPVMICNGVTNHPEEDCAGVFKNALYVKGQ